MIGDEYETKHAAAYLTSEHANKKGDLSCNMCKNKAQNLTISQSPVNCIHGLIKYNYDM